MARTTRRWRLLSLFLAVLMVVSALPLAAIGAFAAEAGENSEGKAAKAANTDVRAVLLDSGRKYFSVDSVKTLIDHMAEYKYNQLQLVIGNGGCRFLLDDMSLSFSGTTLTSDTVKSGIKAGNTTFNGDETCWSQSDMDTIIAYANEKGIEIVPMLNMPGHATAIAAVNNNAYSDNGNINVNDATARAYAVALLSKYATYFAGKGCKTFSFGADESGYTGANMTSFVKDCADAITAVNMTPRAFNDATSVATFDAGIEISYWHKESGSKYAYLLADTDGHNMINTHGRWYYVVKDKQSGEEGTKYMTVTGQNGTQVSVELPSYKHNYYKTYSDSDYPTSLNSYFDGYSTITSDKHKGTMFSIWCDNSTGLTDSQIISTESWGALTQLTYLAELYWPDDLKADASTEPATEPATEAATEAATEPTTEAPEGGATEEPEIDAPSTVTETVNIELTVGEKTTKSYTWKGGLADGYGKTTIATATANTTSKTETTEGKTETTVTPKTALSNGDKIIIGDGTNWLKLNGSSVGNTTDPAEATEWTVTASGSEYTLQSGSRYLFCYSGILTTSTRSRAWTYNGRNFSYTLGRTYCITYSNGWTASYLSSAAAAPAYTRTTTTTPGTSTTTYTTTVSFEGKKVGNTTYYLQSEDGSKTVQFNVTVKEVDLTGAPTLTVELFQTSAWVNTWVENATEIPTDAGHYWTLNPADAYGEAGVLLSSLVPAQGRATNANHQVLYWKGTRLTSANKQIVASAGGTSKVDAGNDFRYIRYYNDKWSFLYNGVWTDVGSTDQIVAYYLQVSDTSPEIVTAFKDYSVDPGSGNNWVYSGLYGIATAVVYPDGSTSPANDAAIYANTLNLYYWLEETTPKMVSASASGGYKIVKVTVVCGDHADKNGNLSTDADWTTDDQVLWEKTDEGTAKEWYKETVLWDAAGNEGQTVITLDGTVWDEYGITLTKDEAILLLFYVEADVPEEEDDSLRVNYVNDSEGSSLIYGYDLLVKSGVDFLGDLSINGTIADRTAGNVTLTGNVSIKNNVNQDQPINYEKLALVGELGSKYTNGDYYYVSAEISADGKTLTLHYAERGYLNIIYWDDVAGTQIQTNTFSYRWIEEGENFLNSMEVDDVLQTYPLNTEFVLPEGACINAYIGDDTTGGNQCIWIRRDLTDDAIGAVLADKELYYCDHAKITNNGNTLELHYLKKNQLKVVYVDDSNGGTEIAVDTTKVPNPFATTAYGVTFDKNGYTSVSAIDVVDFNGNKLVVKDALADVMTDASAYADYYLSNITVEDDGLTLKLHYKQKNTLKVVYWDNNGTTPVEIKSFPSFAVTADGVTFNASYTLTETIKVTCLDGVEKTVVTKLANVEGVDATTYEKYYLENIEVSQDKLTLNLYYRSPIQMKVIYYDQSQNNKVIKTETSFDARVGTTWSYDSTDDVWYANDVDGNKKTYKQKLSDVTGLTGNYAAYASLYQFKTSQTADDGYTLGLYYAPDTYTLTVKWIDDTLTGDAALIYSLPYTVLASSDFLFTTAKANALTGKPNDMYAITSADLSVTLIPSNIQQLATILSEPEKTTYSQDAYYYVKAEVKDDGKTLELHYSKHKDMQVIWRVDGTTTEIHKDTTGTGLTGQLWTTTWNGTTLSNGTYTAEKDLTKISGVSDTYKEYVYVDSDVEGDTLYLNYKLVTLTVNYYERTADGDSLIKSFTVNGSLNAAWTKGTNAWTTTKFDSTTYTATTILKDVPDVTDPYTIEGAFELMAEVKSTDGLTLDLYYEVQTTTVTVKWIDDTLTGDDALIDSKTYTVLDLDDYLFEQELEDLVDGDPGSVYVIMQADGTPALILFNIQELAATLSDPKKTTYSQDAYYFFDAFVKDAGKTLELHYSKVKDMQVVWVDKATGDEIATDTVKGASWDTVWEKDENDSYSIIYNYNGGGGRYDAETDLTELAELGIDLTDPKYAERPYKLVEADTKVVGDTLYLYYELQTVTVKVVWYDDDGTKEITSESYTLDEGKTLADVLTGVTINGTTVTLGTAPALTHNGDTDPATIEQDLTKLTLAAALAAYQSGIYKYVSADLSTDKMTLTLHYDLIPLSGKSVDYVLDYGLPVKIQSLDWLIASQYGLGWGAITVEEVECTGLYGKAELGEDKKSFVYTLTSLMSGIETVTVVAEVGGKQVTLDVNFIPAHNIYYEESFFVNYENGGVDLNGDSNNTLIECETTGTQKELFQDADRVGSYAKYGFDHAYMSDGFSYSAGSALKVTVPYVPKGTDMKYPTLSFSFTGTGFDIISRTGVDQGRIGVTIKQGTTVVKEYGVINRGDNELYQVPVMSVEGLEHGTYEVIITVYPPMEMINRETGEKKFLYGTAQGATFVLDGIRIYDPVDTTDTTKAENAKVLAAYEADSQVVLNRWEFRDLLINQGNELNVTADQGMGTATDREGFINIGPNNEIYLAPGQSFEIELDLKAYEWITPRARALFEEADFAWSFKVGENTEPGSKRTKYSAADLNVSGLAPANDITVTFIFTNVSEDPDAWIVFTDLVITQFNPPEDLG